ncbi:MAG: 16S rRNA (adenine(1518)-N(6)/adenine(1519)-N(6))-dimethyltransferase RsmA [archaeon]
MSNNQSTGSSQELHRSETARAEFKRFKPRRKLGQNFLVDRRQLQRLVDLAEVDQRDIVLEVGAGTGNLTEILQRSAGKVIAVEKDQMLVEHLNKKFEGKSNLQIIGGDVLRIDLPPFDKVVSSPPYNISSALIFTLMQRKFKVASMILQKEFAQRLVAEVGTREYGRLTIMLQHRATAELLDFVPRTSFRPIPKIDSFMVRIVPRDIIRGKEDLFENLVRILFSQRRRLAESVLRRWLEDEGVSGAREIAGSSGIHSKRVFELTTEEIERISESLRNHEKAAFAILDHYRKVSRRVIDTGTPKPQKISDCPATRL